MTLAFLAETKRYVWLRPLSSSVKLLIMSLALAAPKGPAV